MTSDDRLFSLIQRISAIESQLVSRRSFLGDTDAVGARYYRELQELRRELDMRLGYGTHSTATGESPDDESTPDAGGRRHSGGAGARSARRQRVGSTRAGAEVRRLGGLLGEMLGKRGGTEWSGSRSRG